jgi:flagellar biosynthesis/type III secretory pathway protein FliH
MGGANASLLIKAIDEMVEYYQGRSEERLAEDLRWMGVVLRRAKILPLEEKQEVEEKLSMYDDLLERDPKIRKQSKAEGRAEGKAEGLQEAVVTIVKRRFPTLTELAEQKVAGITKPAQLESLLEQVVDAPDEAAARFLLSTKADRSEEVERVR